MILPELGAYLVAQGIGTLATDLFLGFLPDTPDDCVVLYEYGGLASEHTFKATPGAAWENPRVQIVARAKVYNTGRTKIENTYKKLDGLINTTMTGVRYLGIFAIQSPFFLDRDERGRNKFAFNAQVMKELS